MAQLGSLELSVLDGGVAGTRGGWDRSAGAVFLEGLGSAFSPVNLGPVANLGPIPAFKAVK